MCAEQVNAEEPKPAKVVSDRQMPDHPRGCVERVTSLVPWKACSIASAVEQRSLGLVSAVD